MSLQGNEKKATDLTKFSNERRFFMLLSFWWPATKALLTAAREVFVVLAQAPTNRKVQKVGSPITLP